MKKFIKENYKKMLFLICIVLFLFICEDVFTEEIIKMDSIGYNIMNSIRSDNLTKIVKVITNMGSAAVLISINAIILIFVKNKKIGLSLLGNLCLITILNQLGKFVFQRPRPIYKLIEEVGYSFPSGHSMISMAFYGYLIYIIYKYIKNKYIKYSLMTFLSLIIILIGLSRIYLGVHYVSDVAGGFLFSISYLIVYTNIMKKSCKI